MIKFISAIVIMAVLTGPPFLFAASISDTVYDRYGSPITGSGKEVYIKCYNTTGTGNDIRPDDNAPAATTTTDTGTGAWSVGSLTDGSIYFCTFGFYDTTPIAGAAYYTAH